MRPSLLPPESGPLHFRDTARIYTHPKILPVFCVASIGAAVARVNAAPSPLALYCFTSSASVVEKIAAGTCSGGMCVNDVVVHMANETLPFGGCGASGMGCYHGKYGFDAFSHLRALMRVESGAPAVGRYPPW